MKKRYWLSFDLGLKGNYEQLYEWLDTMKANECGDFMATFLTDKTSVAIKDELIRILDDKARIYLIEYNKGGRFTIGLRKRAPWAGYAPGTQTSEIEK